MKSARKLLATVFASLLLALAGATAALAQTPIDPSATVTENESATAPINPFGISISLAMILGLTGLLVVLIIIIRYMRYAPRFSQDEESMKVVRADRVVLGQELPRRNVDLSQAAPVLVAPPAVPTSLPAASTEAPAAAAAPEPVAVAAAAPAPAACRRIRPSAGRRSAAAAPAAAPAPGPCRDGGAARGLARSGDLRRDPQRAPRRRYRSPDRRGQGSPRRHDRGAQEGRRRSLSHRSRRSTAQ